jgi:hypothetical protein
MTAGEEKVVLALDDVEEKEVELLPMLLSRPWLLLLLP